MAKNSRFNYKIANEPLYIGDIKNCIDSKLKGLRVLESKTNQFANRFHTTQWSLVVKAAGHNPTSRLAMNELCQSYWYPLYAFQRHRGASVQEAEDSVQSFFSHVLEKQIFQYADPNRGRFRGFLIAAFRQFLAKRYEYESAAKRKPSTNLLSIDAVVAEGRYSSELSDWETAERLYEYTWAISVLELAMNRLREEQKAQNQERRFEILYGTLTSQNSQSFDELSKALGISEGAARIAVHRLRQRYGAILREEVAATLMDGVCVDDELRNLLASLEIGRSK